MDPNVPKSEREHYAARRIAELEAKYSLALKANVADSRRIAKLNDEIARLEHDVTRQMTIANVERARAEAAEAAIKAAVEAEREAIIKWLLDYGWFDELDLIAVNAIKAIRARGGE